MYARRPHPKRPTVPATRTRPAYPNTNATARGAAAAFPRGAPPAAGD